MMVKFSHVSRRGVRHACRVCQIHDDGEVAIMMDYEARGKSVTPIDSWMVYQSRIVLLYGQFVIVDAKASSDFETFFMLCTLPNLRKCFKVSGCLQSPF